MEGAVLVALRLHQISGPLRFWVSGCSAVCGVSRAAGLGEFAAFLLEINIKCREAFAGTLVNETCERFRNLCWMVTQCSSGFSGVVCPIQL